MQITALRIIEQSAAGGDQPVDQCEQASAKAKATQIPWAGQRKRHGKIQERRAAVTQTITADLVPHVTPELVVERKQKQPAAGNVED